MGHAQWKSFGVRQKGEAIFSQGSKAQPLFIKLSSSGPAADSCRVLCQGEVLIHDLRNLPCKQCCISHFVVLLRKLIWTSCLHPTPHFLPRDRSIWFLTYSHLYFVHFINSTLYLFQSYWTFCPLIPLSSFTLFRDRSIKTHHKLISLCLLRLFWYIL